MKPSGSTLLVFLLSLSTMALAQSDFVDVAGNIKYGHMSRAVFTIIDANHHIEEWTSIFPGNKQVRAHFDLKRTGTIASK